MKWINLTWGEYIYQDQLIFNRIIGYHRKFIDCGMPLIKLFDKSINLKIDNGIITHRWKFLTMHIFHHSKRHSFTRSDNASIIFYRIHIGSILCKLKCTTLYSIAKNNDLITFSAWNICYVPLPPCIVLHLSRNSLSLIYIQELFSSK
jgi:hypothetical protein